MSEFNQLLDFFNLFDSRFVFTLLHDSVNLVINAFISEMLGAWFRINDVERVCRSWTVLHPPTVHQCAVFWVSYFAR